MCSSVHSEILAGDATKFLRHPLPLFFHPKEGGGEEKRCRLRMWRGRGRRDAERQEGDSPPLALPQPASWRPRLQRGGGGGSCRESRGMSVGSAAAAAASQWEALEHTEEGARPLSEPLPPFHRPLSLRRRRRRWMESASATLTEREREREVQKRVWKLQSRPLGLSPWRRREAVAVAVAMGKPLREGVLPPPPTDSSPPVERGLRWADPKHTFFAGR